MTERYAEMVFYLNAIGSQKSEMHGYDKFLVTYYFFRFSYLWMLEATIEFKISQQRICVVPKKKEKRF